MNTSITISIEAIAQHLASMWDLRQNDYISADELRAVRFSIETMFGADIYNKARELSLELINA